MKATQAPTPHPPAQAPASRRPGSSGQADRPAAAPASPLGIAERLERAGRLGHRAADLRITRPAADLHATLPAARTVADLRTARTVDDLRTARSAADRDAALPAAGPAVPIAARPGAEQSAPIQPAWDWKKKLAAGAGLLGAGGLAAGLALGLPGLAVAGGAALLGGAAYGAYRAYKSWRRPRPEAAPDAEREPLRLDRDAAGGSSASASAGASRLDAARAPLAEVPGGERFPPNMHFVWLGGAVPEERRQNIDAWRQQAPGVTPNLWLDRNSARASAEHVGAMERSGVRIRNIGDLGGERFANAQRLLPTADEGGVNRAATGALSDIARLEILRQEGGHYMDSDNTPGPEAHRFADMSSAAGLRLGHGALAARGARLFSNDAMSAQPDNEFVNSYLNQSYQRLNERSAADITSRDAERTRPAVMNTTGPAAMADLKLPATEDEAAATADEMRQDSLDMPRDRITINTFAHSDNALERGLHPTLRTVYGRIGYGRALFNRGLGNAWVDPQPRRSDDDKKVR